ncbi:alpha/beta-Hydrolases superfamily protein [Zea mays]|uniref:Alpha/beta-Hydrolases superfamily protein n=1 Tax=Zea mays TaxID=4577 RepID=A0A1D6MBA4_MAIZE|nr:alpha/beta-Hydrolases superfamily protein [Zea mays]
MSNSKTLVPVTTRICTFSMYGNNNEDRAFLTPSKLGMTASWLTLLMPSQRKELVLFGLIFLEMGKVMVNSSMEATEKRQLICAL